jgi:proteasome lid subunit RPN8/RPN11
MRNEPPKKLAETAMQLVQTRKRLLAVYVAAAEKCDSRRMSYIHRKLQDTTKILSSLSELEHELNARSSTERFIVSSLFLHDCFKELTADACEEFFFITGSEAEGLLVLDQRCGFEHVSRTPAGVEGDQKSTHKLLCKLESFGHRLLAHFHSHPGRGAGATLPSATDRSFQERLERGGYPSVAAIFSRDGIVRFFRLDNSFELEIHGKGVEEIEPNVFRLNNIG